MTHSCFYINVFPTPSEIFTADYIHFKNSGKIAEWTMMAWVDRLAIEVCRKRKNLTEGQQKF